MKLKRTGGVNNSALYVQLNLLLEYGTSTTTGTIQGLTPQTSVILGELSEWSASFHALDCTCQCSLIINI
jgi:hypothetical protein